GQSAAAQQRSGTAQLLANSGVPPVGWSLNSTNIADHQIKDTTLSQSQNGQSAVIQNHPVVSASSNGKNRGGAAPSTKSKNGRSSSGDSAFGLEVKLGMNTGAGASPYFGIAAGYYFTPRISLMVGVDVKPSRLISGRY